jgi:hypothetical protein
MLVVYGINEESETITPITHLGLLTSKEAQKVELWDFFQSAEEDAPAPFNDRLVVVDGFTDIARHRGETAAQYLGRELIGNFLVANPDRFFPFLPQHEVAYVGSVQGGHVRALVRERGVGGGRGPGPLRPLGGGPDQGRGGRPREGQGPGPEGGLPGPESTPLAGTFFGGGGFPRPRRLCP